MLFLTCGPQSPAAQPKVQHQGIRGRDYYVYVPSSLQPGPAPVFMILHGHAPGQVLDGELTIKLYGLIAKAEANGFILVAPSATPCPAGQMAGSLFWNSGMGKTCPESKADDVSFLKEVVTDLPRKFKVQIDPKRVFIAGHSGGAMMAYRMACEAFEVVAAVAAVEGAYPPGKACEMPNPVSVIAFHGTGDTSLPYIKGQSITECLVNNTDPYYCYRGNTAGQTIDILATANKCDPMATSLRTSPAQQSTLTTSNLKVPSRTTLTYTKCRSRSEVQFHKLQNGEGNNFGAHFYWPQEHTDLIWEFFAGHPR